jgi:hypothetical protein
MSNFIMWTKREFPMGRVDMLMENDKSVPHQNIGNSRFVHMIKLLMVLFYENW